MGFPLLDVNATPYAEQLSRHRTGAVKRSRLDAIE